MRSSLQTLSCVISADKDANKELAARDAGERRFPLSPLRVHPLVVAKTALTGAAAERIDTRILRVLYKIESEGGALYLGQQMDVFISSDAPERR